MAFQRPGVFVEETSLPSVAETGGGISSAVILGEHHRGPTEPTRVTSWTDFRNHYGSFGGGDLPFAAFLFFHNGGSSLWVKRVEGTGGDAATRDLNDRAATPVPTLRVDALNNGEWGNEVFVEVADAGTEGRFSLVVYSGGTSGSHRVERWQDLSMDATDGRYVEKVVNHPAMGSTHVEVTDLDSASASPDNVPAVQSATALTGGVNGTVTNTEITDAIETLGAINEPFSLNIPNVQDATVIGEAITYAESRGDVVVVIDPSADDTVASVTSFAESLSSSYAAVYYPHLYFSDPASSEANAVRLLPPGGAVLGKFAEVDSQRGVHKSPAGLDVRLRGAAGLPQRFSPSDLDALNSSNVNAIRNVPGAGLVIMGSRTLSDRLSERHLSVRRTLIDIKAQAKDLTQFAVFEPNDENLWATISARLGQFLRGRWQEGALRGGTSDEAFYVKCDGELNTDAVVLNGEVRVEIGVATQRPAEFVVIRVGQWQGGQNAEEIV